MYFAAKKDKLFSFLIWGTMIIVYLPTSIRMVLEGLNIITDTISFFVVLLLGLIWFRTGYEVEDQTIAIQGALRKKEINIADITKITKTKSFLAGSALAIERLILELKEDEDVHLSPRTEAEFIALLLEKNPKIKFVDELKKAT